MKVKKSLHEVCSSYTASSKEGLIAIAVSRSFEKGKKRKNPSKIHKIRPGSPRDTPKVPN
jgi:hypothetical protein